MVVLCGCFYLVSGVCQYLPQLEVEGHTSVLAATSRTTLIQHFANPGKDTLKEICYVFPLYDGVSVVGFKCTIGDRVLNGIVKERDQAKQDFKGAKARGETVGLLEQSIEAADVFTTSLGNVGGGYKVKVEITFIGELKHDAEVDGVRFSLPSSISPRYGSSSVSGSNFNSKGISFTLDAEVPEGSAITAIRSPSHPIAVSVGTISTAPDDSPSLRKASATLSLGTVELGDDIIIQIVSSNVGDPSAVVERHPTVDTQALMVTLVPKFSLPADKPEIVFVCDRSGSMVGSIEDLQRALRIFLKSLPVGVKFNICSFGNHFTFLWPKSKSYSQQSLAEATAHIDTFSANYGGTAMYEPIKATFTQRFKDMNLEVFLLTDGEIWAQDQLFDLINEHVAQAKGAIRVFTLGVGIGASSSLIEGVARAGNGFAQTTTIGEKMDKKVVRMLKGALFPHITDYWLEVKYHQAERSDDDSDFELVEKVSSALVISPAKESGKSPVKKMISLFQRDLKDDTAAETSKDKFGHLPVIEAPRYVQTPTKLPALFPFNRTTAYVIINGNSSIPKSVILKGTSQHGPLELEIPVTQLKDDATTIHQLAARREMKELEEGRGWLTLAKDARGKLIKNKHEGRFSDMLEREAVRLGTMYQVAGKYTSLIAVEQQGAKEIEMGTRVPPPYKASYGGGGASSALQFHNHTQIPSKGAGPAKRARKSIRRSSMDSFSFAAAPSAQPPVMQQSARAQQSQQQQQLQQAQAPVIQQQAACAPQFQQTQYWHQVRQQAPATQGYEQQGQDMSQGPVQLFQNQVAQVQQSHQLAQQQAPRSRLRRQSSSSQALSPVLHSHSVSSAYCSVSPSYSPTSPSSAASPDYGAVQKRAKTDHVVSEFEVPQELLDGMVMPTPDEDSDEDMGFAFDDPTNPPVVDGPIDHLEKLTVLQSFNGSWSWSKKLRAVLSFGPEAAAKLSIPAAAAADEGKNDIFATACTIVFFKKKLNADQEAWEMMIEKAEDWLATQVGAEAAALLKAVEGLF